MGADTPAGHGSTWGWAGETAARGPADRVVLTDGEGVILETRGDVDALLGVSAERLAGRPLEEFVDAGGRAEYREVLAAAAAGVPRREWLAWLKPPALAPVPAVVATSLDASSIRWVLRGPESARGQARRMEAALAEKDARLAEVVHRVKNNLQLVSSLLNLQAQAEPLVAPALQAAKSRVLAMAMVHDALARTGEGGALDLRDYVARLAQCYGGPGRLRSDVGDVQVTPRQAVPLALILNELVGNAVRHAFPPPRTGEVLVRLAGTPVGLEIVVKDDGVGRGDAPRGLGLQLVELWVEELGGRLQWEPGPGTTARVTVGR